MSKPKPGDFLKASPQDFRERAIGLASEYDAMLRSDAYKLLFDFQQLQVQGYLNTLEMADSYEEFLKAKAGIDGIKKARNLAYFLLDDIKAELALSSADGMSPKGSQG